MASDAWWLLGLKLAAFVAYVFAFFGGVPLAMVGTGMLITHWLGSAWWVGLIIAPIVLAEFIAAFSFVFWEDNPIPRWVM